MTLKTLTDKLGTADEVILSGQWEPWHDMQEARRNLETDGSCAFLLEALAATPICFQAYPAAPWPITKQ
jgi:hypothetical protein